MRLEAGSHRSPAEGVCIVELDNPPVNSLGAETLIALGEVVRALDDAAAVRVIVFTSAH